MRTRTGALILSVVRNEQPLPTPGPETRLAAGDLLVVFGPHEAVDRAIELFEPSDHPRE
jgi:TrkA domain protein